MTKNRTELLKMVWKYGNVGCTPIILLWIMYVELGFLCEQMTGQHWYPLQALALLPWTFFVCYRRLRLLRARRRHSQEFGRRLI